MYWNVVKMDTGYLEQMKLDAAQKDKERQERMKEVERQIKDLKMRKSQSASLLPKVKRLSRRSTAVLPFIRDLHSPKEAPERARGFRPDRSMSKPETPTGLPRLDMRSLSKPETPTGQSPRSIGKVRCVSEPSNPATPSTQRAVPIGDLLNGAQWSEALTEDELEPSVGSVQTLLQAALPWFQTPKRSSIVAPAVYVVGGYRAGWSTAERFDPAVGGWELLPPMASGIPRERCAAAIVGTALFVVGGKHEEAQRTADMLDLVDGTWRTLPLMRHARVGAVAVAFGSVLCVLGGNDQGNVGECFDTDKNVWHDLPSLLKKREDFAAASFNGKLWVFGGRSLSVEREMLRSVECFDPKVGLWEEEMQLPRPFLSCRASVVKDHLYVMSCGEPCGLWRLSMESGGWDELPAPELCRGESAVASLSDKLYVLGSRSTLGALKHAECYDPDDGMWFQLPPMQKPRCFCAATAYSA